MFSITLIFALTAVAANYLSKRITIPIISLRDAARAISHGNLDTRIEINTRDELEELASTFNEMAIMLKQFYTVLEQKVQERTKELEEAKKQLENSNIGLEDKVQARTRELEELKNNLEKTVEQRTVELNQKLAELERMNSLMTSRELKMVELKKEIEDLKIRLNDTQS